MSTELEVEYIAAVRPDGTLLPARIVAVDDEIIEWLRRRRMTNHEAREMAGT